MDLRQLREAVRNRQAVLFSGAGVSMNLGVPSPGALMERMAEATGHDPAELRGLAEPLTLTEFYYAELGCLGPLRRWMTVGLRLLEDLHGPE